jgi:hypothetical protein
MKIPEGWLTAEVLDIGVGVFQHWHNDEATLKEKLKMAIGAMLSAAPAPPDCQECNGEYAVDSGGTHPWGEAALIPCPKCSPTPPEVEPIAEIVAEDMGNPFNAARIRAHFYKEIPPIGTKLYAAPTQPEVDALKEELNSWRNTAAERTMQKAALLDELVTLKVENEKLKIHAEYAPLVIETNKELNDENEKLRKDAERYRWLRDPCVDIRPIVKYRRGDYGSAFLTYQSLDAAIDAAMTAPDTKGE